MWGMSFGGGNMIAEICLIEYFHNMKLIHLHCADDFQTSTTKLFFSQTIIESSCSSSDQNNREWCKAVPNNLLVDCASRTHPLPSQNSNSDHLFTDFPWEDICLLLKTPCLFSRQTLFLLQTKGCSGSGSAQVEDYQKDKINLNCWKKDPTQDGLWIR
jgi:hypothetical protein